MINLLQPLSHVVAKFLLDGKEYEMEHFKVEFIQSSDYKGQPQHETQGGQILLTLTQSADDNLYLWAKKSILLKSGTIEFQTEMSSPVLRVEFFNAYCVNLTREVDAVKGTTTSLVIAPEIIKMNGVEHDNFWKK